MHIISFLLSCSFLFLQIENKNIDEIVIKYVNYNVYTYQNIGCKEFENFSEKIKTINIKDKNEIDRLGRIVRKLTITKSNTPDVRVKIEFKHEKEIIKTICMDRFSLEIDGETHRYSQELFQYVEKIKKKYGNN